MKYPPLRYAGFHPLKALVLDVVLEVFGCMILDDSRIERIARMGLGVVGKAMSVASLGVDTTMTTGLQGVIGGSGPATSMGTPPLRSRENVE